MLPVKVLIVLSFSMNVKISQIMFIISKCEKHMYTVMFHFVFYFCFKVK